MNKKNEFTAEDISIVIIHFYFNIEKDSIEIDIDDNRKPFYTFWLELNFDAEKKFNIKLNEDEWINAYIQCDFYFDNIKMIYIIDKPDDSEYHSYLLSKEEKEILREKIIAEIDRKNLSQKNK